MTVKEMPDQIIFLHQVQPGGADRSYGIEAGRLAGLPPSVISRARQVMGQIEQHSKIAVGLRENPEAAAFKTKEGTRKRKKEKTSQKTPKRLASKKEFQVGSSSKPVASDVAVTVPGSEPEEQLDIFG